MSGRVVNAITEGIYMGAVTNDFGTSGNKLSRKLELSTTRVFLDTSGSVRNPKGLTTLTPSSTTMSRSSAQALIHTVTNYGAASQDERTDTSDIVTDDSYPDLENLTRIFCSGTMCTIAEDSNITAKPNSTVKGEPEEINWAILLLSTLVLLGILGNILVIMAISTEKKLQTVTNYFLLSLAVADLLVSVIVMPFGMTQLLIGFWPFGVEVCDLWCFSDVLMCTASIMHMCTISLDRYLGIANPLKNRNKSRHIVMIKIFVVWAISLAISSPVLILGFVEPSNVFNEVNAMCVLNNTVFQLFGSSCAFIIPLIIMFVSYTLTIKLLHRQAKLCSSKGNNGHPRMRRSISRWGESGYHRKLSRMNSNSSIISSTSAQSNSYNSHGSNSHTLSIQLNGHNNSTKRLRPDSESSIDECDTCELDTLMKTNSLMPIPETNADGSSSPKLRHMINKHKYAVRAAGVFINKREERQEKKIQSVKTEQKASKVLGGVFISFVICWLPFFLANILISACPECGISQDLMSFCVWLGWASSILNPIIYTIANKTFKRKFVNILLCTYTKNNNHMPSRYVKISFKTKPRLPEPITCGNDLPDKERQQYLEEYVTVC